MSASQTDTAEPRRNLKKQVQTVGEDVSELGRLAREAARQEMQSLLERGGESVDAARDRARAWEESVEKTVRDAPIKSLLCAAGVGALLGLFLRR